MGKSLNVIGFYLLCCYCAIASSSNNNFDRRHDQVLYNLITTNISLAHKVADSLLIHAKTEEEKIKANMLLARLYENAGDISNCLRSALRADTISNTVMSHSWQANTSVFLATTYRRLGLYRLSKDYLEKAQKANLKQLNSDIYMLNAVEILHEECFQELELKDYTKARESIRKAHALMLPYIEKDQRLLTPLAVNDLLRGFCEYYLGNTDIAESYAHAALGRIEKSQNRLTPYSLILLAKVALHKQENSDVHKYLMMCMPYLQTTKYEELKILIFGAWVEYYQQIGDINKALEYSQEEKKIIQTKNLIARDLSDQIVMELNASQNLYEKSNVLILWFSGLLISLAAIGIYLVEKRRKAYKLLYENSLNKPTIEADTLELLTREIAMASKPLPKKEKSEIAESTEKNVKISKDTESRLLEDFEKLEDELFFIKKNISLQQLASDLGTNTRYVTHILQKYRGNTFYDYLQLKRVEYIMNEIREHPELADYKMSYLADMSGFASLSKFSVSFKKISGMPPSVFMHIVKTENKV